MKPVTTLLKEGLAATPTGSCLDSASAFPGRRSRAAPGPPPQPFPRSVPPVMALVEELARLPLIAGPRAFRRSFAEPWLESEPARGQALARYQR